MEDKRWKVLGNSPISFLLLDCVRRERDTLCVFLMPRLCISGGLRPIGHALETKRKGASGRAQKKNSFYITSSI